MIPDLEHSEAGPRLTPEARLLLAVLTRAMLDAMGGAGPTECFRAQNWLRGAEPMWRPWRDTVLVHCGVDRRVFFDWLKGLQRPYQLFKDHDFAKTKSDLTREQEGEKPANTGPYTKLPRQGRRRK